MAKIAEKDLTILAMTGSLIMALLGCTWTLQGRITTIESKMDAIPEIKMQVKELAVAQAKQDTAIKYIQRDVTAMQGPLENTQANVRDIIKQIKNMNQGPVALGPFNRGPSRVR